MAKRFGVKAPAKKKLIDRWASRLKKTLAEESLCQLVCIITQM